MKKLILMIAALSLSAILLICGCFGVGEKGADGRDGKDGKDGQDVSIYEIYESVKNTAGNENLTYEQFLKEYLSFSDDEISQSVNPQAVINKSLMSSVSILTRFSYSNYGRTTYKVYAGSGVFLSVNKETGDGYVVTNCHVVYDDTSNEKYANEVRLYLYGQDVKNVNYSYDSNYNFLYDSNYVMLAEVIGAAKQYDVALLKITGSDVIKRNEIYAAEFSDSDDVYVGDKVYLVGNAKGEGVSCASGIVTKDSEFIDLSLSDKNPNDLTQYRVIRTDAPVNHGNSGGGMFDYKGKLVGLVNSKNDESDIDNMGYALPASNVKRLVKLMYDEYTANGGSVNSSFGVNRALLNITTEITDSYAQYDENRGLAEIYETVAVNEVTGSPALNKLKSKDVIKHLKITDGSGNTVEDKEITRRYYVTDLLLSVRQGYTVSLTIVRGGEDISVDIPYDSSAYFTYYD